MKRSRFVSQTRRPGAMGRKPERGFSLIELMIVIAIILSILVAAAPSMINVVSSARERGSMSSMATYTQRVRGDAVRSNQTKSLWNVASNGEYFLYSANGANTAPGLTGADGVLPAGKQVVYVGTPTGSNVPTVLDTQMAFGVASSSITVNTGTAISFNSRGVPCYWDTTAGNCNTTGQAFVWYFIFQPPFGSSRWACLSISPAGRIKTWYWDGVKWSN